MAAIDSGRVVAELRARLDELAQVDVALLPDQCVRDELLALLTVANQVQAQVACRLAVFDARNLSVVDGFRTATGFVSAFARVEARPAKQLLADGRLLRSMPELGRAAVAGAVTREHLGPVHRLVKDLDLATVVSSDQPLAFVAAACGVGEVQRACDRIRALLDPDGPEPDPDRDFERRSFSMVKRGSQFVVRGQLDSEGGAALRTALDALMRPPTADDDRSFGQRMADAVTELAMGALASGSLPTVHGERPQLGLLITPAALLGDRKQPLTLRERVVAFLEWLRRQDAAWANSAQAILGDVTADLIADPVDAAGPSDSETSTRGSPDPATAGGGGDRMPGADDPASRRERQERQEWQERPGQPGRPEGSGRPDRPERLGRSVLNTVLSPPCTECGHTPPAVDDWAWLNWVGEIPRDLAKRLACDAEVWRLVLDPSDGQPLDVGRTHRTATRWIRKALIARDRGCRWPGCAVPAEWTDAHHQDHWIKGGRTQVDKLVLLCRWHHRQVHEGGWTLVFDAATAEVTVTRPDGTPYELGPSLAYAGPTTRVADGRR